MANFVWPVDSSVGVTPTSSQTGTVLLAAGIGIVVNPLVTSSSIVFLTPQSHVTNSGAVSVSSLTPGVGFTITSTNILDVALVAWLVVTPAS